MKAVSRSRKRLLAAGVILLTCALRHSSGAAEESGNADDAKLFADYLKFSQEVATRQHLIVHATFEREKPKAKPIEFRYDRYPERERIQPAGGASYVRKKGKGWMKSEDWGETGKPAPAPATRDFDSWIGLVNAPLGNISSSHDPKQGGIKPMRVENEGDAKPDEIRFILSREHPTSISYPHFGFTKFQNSALLHFYGGGMRLGEERLTASIGYDWMFLVNVATSSPGGSASPSPSASPASH